MAEQSSIEDEISCKILLLGPSGAGKTSNLLALKEQINLKNSDINKD